VLRFGAFHHEEIISPSHHDARMPEFILFEEQWGEHIHLERVEYSGARGLVKENYVAGLELTTNVFERYDGMSLVPEAPALDPSDRPARIRHPAHDIILS
jgi:hypothetical protein